MKKIKAGIIGCGGIGMQKHMPALANLEHVEMVAFCDIIESRAVEACEKFGTEEAKAYIDYNELLKDRSIDVIHVCTPNNSHMAISIAAMEADKHVLCEKPMAKTAAEARKMLEAQKKTGKILSIAYQNRFRNDSQFLQKACRNGDLGKSTLQKPMP